MSLLTFLLRRSRGIVAISIAAALAGALGGVALLALVHRAISGDGAPSASAGWLFAGLCLVVAGSRVVAQGAMARLGLGAVSDLTERACRRVLSLPLARFEAIDGAGLQAVLTEDIAVVANALVGLPQVCLNLPAIAVGLAYLGWLAPTVFGVAAAIAGGAVGVYLMLTGPAMDHVRASKAGRDRLVGHVRTLLDGFRELKVHEGRATALAERGIAPASAEVRSRGIAAQDRFALAEGWGQLAFFGLLGVLVFVLPALRSVDRGTLGGVVLVALYVMGPLDVVLTWLPTLGRARASVERVEALLPSLQADEPAASPDRSVPAFAPPRESIRLAGVTHAYPPSGTDREGFTLGPVDLVLRPGEVVILAGGNGAGKTTLVKVLAGLYPPGSGSIAVDGRVVGPTEADRAAYRGLFTVVYADGFLFPDYLGVAPPGSTRDLGSEALAGLDRLGLAARVGVDREASAFSTTALSQGQRRRLALLGAQLEDRPAIVFDEWAANQDPRFKRAFYREILPAMRAEGKILLVISHDEAHHGAADRVVRLDGGRVVEDAPPDLNPPNIVREPTDSDADAEPDEHLVEAPGFGPGNRR